MNFYLVTYDGMWLGGKAVVAADSEEEALELVKAHANTCRFNSVAEGMSPLAKAPEVKYIPVPGPCVLYNDNGDY